MTTSWWYPSLSALQAMEGGAMADKFEKDCLRKRIRELEMQVEDRQRAGGGEKVSMFLSLSLGACMLTHTHRRHLQ